MKTNPLLALVSVFVILVSCSGSQEPETEARNLSQIYEEEGYPVAVRELNPSAFTVDLKFPAEFNARTQSTAYAGLAEVVRDVGFSVGDYVERNGTVVTFSLDNPQYLQAKLGYENAKTAFDRMSLLFSENGVSRQDYDNARTQFELAREAFRSIGDLIEVQAPISGYITQINVQKSSNVRPGDALFTISNMDGYEALFYVSASEIDDIRVGAPTKIENETEVLSGTVSEVSLNIDPRRKAFLARASFEGKPRTLVSGMSVDVSVECYRNEEAIVVLRKEMLRSGEGWSAFVVEDGHSVMKPVRIGRDRGLEFEITEGLEPGDLLISKGADGLQPGSPVRIIETVAMER